MVARNRLAEGVGLFAGVAALAMGGIAAGLELERRLVSKRIDRSSQAELAEFFALRSDGPTVTTADGVVLHTEVDDGPGRRLHPGLGARLRPEPGQLALPAPALPGLGSPGLLRPAVARPVQPLGAGTLPAGPAGRSTSSRCWTRWPGRTGGPGRALDGRDDDHAAGPEPAGAVRHPGGRRRSAAHLGRGDGRPLTDPWAARAYVLPGGRAADGLAEPDPRAGRADRRAGSDLATWPPGGWPSPPTCRPATSSSSARCWPRRRWRWSPTSIPAFDELDEYEALAGIGRVPTVVVGGEDDLFTPVGAHGQDHRAAAGRGVAAADELRAPGHDRAPRGGQRAAGGPADRVRERLGQGSRLPTPASR